MASNWVPVVVRRRQKFTMNGAYASPSVTLTFKITVSFTVFLRIPAELSRR